MFHGLKRPVLVSVIVAIGVFHGDLGLAQEDIDLNAIEAEMSRRGEEQAERSAPVTTDKESPLEKPVTMKDLPKLSEFSDISVIQRKFMPKTNRFQLYGGVDFLTNNPFFDTYGANIRLAFFFNEFVGLELNYWKHSVSDRPITSDLQSKFSVTTKTMLSSLGYQGLSLMLVPFYGKITFLNKRIIPYDLYVSAGVGTTETSYTDKAAPSVHLATGEIFSLSKNFAWRWEFSNVIYTAAAPKMSSTSGELVDSGKKRSISDLYLGIGLTLLFPGAKYR